MAYLPDLDWKSLSSFKMVSFSRKKTDSNVLWSESLYLSG